MELATLEGLDQWPKMRKKIESSARSVLQLSDPSTVDLQVKVMDEFDEPGYTRKRINYFVDDWTRISAWLLVPEEAEDFPAIICMHRAVAMGKDEPAGHASGDPSMAFAKYYAQMGYVTLAPDCISAGERIYSRRDAYDTEPFYKENGKASAIGKMLQDHMRCVDVLSDMREVDPGRIGIFGHGLGGLNALVMAAFDERLRCCVTSGGITSVAEGNAPEWWAPKEDGLVLAPKMKAALDSGKVPFEWDQIMGLCAPLPLLILSAKNDDSLVNTASLEGLVGRARHVYEMLGETDSIHFVSHEDPEPFPISTQDAADAWLDRWL